MNKLHKTPEAKSTMKKTEIVLKTTITPKIPIHSVELLDDFILECQVIIKFQLTKTNVFYLIH